MDAALLKCNTNTNAGLVMIRGTAIMDRDETYILLQKIHSAFRYNTFQLVWISPTICLNRVESFETRFVEDVDVIYTCR